MTEHSVPSVSPLSAGLRCRCPRCGRGRLFRGFLSLARCCGACGLDYSTADAGDGPAFFVVLVVGTVITVAAVVVELAYTPPYWLHALLWIPATLLLSLALLRPFKATLVALQYRHKAAEGRMVDHP
jgi:uncharacterized protein (DUF983 family)